MLGAEQTDENDQDNNAGDRDVVELATELVRSGPVALHVLFTLDALGRQFENPRENDSRDEAERENQNYRPRRPFRRPERRQDGRQHLGQQPAHDEVGRSDTKYVTTSEFDYQRHAGHSTA